MSKRILSVSGSSAVNLSVTLPEPSPFGGLSTDLCLKIFEKTSLETLSRLARSCKTFSAIVMSSNCAPFKIFLYQANNRLIEKSKHLQKGTTPMSTSDKSSYFNMEIISIAKSLPGFILFPQQPSNPIVPFMQTWFEALSSKGNEDILKQAISILRTQFYPSSKAPYEYQGGSRGFEPTWSLTTSSKDQKFLYHLPDVLLEFDSLAELQEITRRLKMNDKQMESRCVTLSKKFIEEFAETADCGVNLSKDCWRFISKAISSELLEKIFNCCDEEENYFLESYLQTAFDFLDDDDQALEKLICTARAYQKQWNRTPQEDLWKNTALLFANIEEIDENETISQNDLLSWIPPPILEVLKQTSNRSSLLNVIKESERLSADEEELISDTLPFTESVVSKESENLSADE
jgi:hypothetical protein